MSKILKKIIIKVLSISLIKRGVERVCHIYDRVCMEIGLNLFNRKQELGMMNFRHYLPNTEERIKRLRKVINKRPVVIILPGSSVRELEQRIRELKNCDVCYLGLNGFWIIEKYILEKINRNLSVVMCAANPGGWMDNINDFLERREDNIFISVKSSFSSEKTPKDFDFDEFIKKYNEKLLFFISVSNLSSIIIKQGSVFLRQSPSIKYPLHFLALNSLSALLSLALIGEASKVIIFGADGGRTNPPEVYFGESDSEYQSFTPEQKLMIDAENFNKTMPLILKKIYRAYNLKPIDIINCSKKSYYTLFRKLSYDETFDLLKHGKSI